MHMNRRNFLGTIIIGGIGAAATVPDFLSPVSANPVFINDPGVKHQREILLLDELQQRINAKLGEFLYTVNNSQPRNQIRFEIDQILREYHASGVIYEYDVICDERNNISTMIDKNEACVDAYLKLTRSAKFIHLRTMIQ